MKMPNNSIFVIKTSRIPWCQEPFFIFIKYYSLINHNLIYDNLSINRYTSFDVNADKAALLLKLKKNIDKIKNCELKKNALNQVFADGYPDAKIISLPFPASTIAFHFSGQDYFFSLNIC